jgi:hypothetical protein
MPRAVRTRGFQTRMQPAADASETKLLVRRGPIEVKIEVNFVMRGTSSAATPLTPGANLAHRFARFAYFE